MQGNNFIHLTIDKMGGFNDIDVLIAATLYNKGEYTLFLIKTTKLDKHERIFIIRKVSNALTKQCKTVVKSQLETNAAVCCY